MGTVVYRKSISPLYRTLCGLIVLLAVTAPRISRGENSEVLLNAMQGTLSIGNATGIAVNAGYYFTAVRPWVQLGLTSGLTYTSVLNSSATNFEIMAGPTFNIPAGGAYDIDNAFFMSARAGLQIATSGILSNAYFAFEFALGKRFQIFPNVTYRPDVGIRVVSGTIYFVARALSFSLLF